MSSCVNNEVYNRENFTIQPLIPNSQYHVTIQAASVQYPLETLSVVHEMDIFTLSELINCISAKMIVIKLRNIDIMIMSYCMQWLIM